MTSTRSVPALLLGKQPAVGRTVNALECVEQMYRSESASIVQLPGLGDRAARYQRQTTL